MTFVKAHSRAVFFSGKGPPVKRDANHYYVSFCMICQEKGFVFWWLVNLLPPNVLPQKQRLICVLFHYRCSDPSELTFSMSMFFFYRRASCFPWWLHKTSLLEDTFKQAIYNSIGSLFPEIECVFSSRKKSLLFFVWLILTDSSLSSQPE